jgi:hypothetical protein
MMMMMTMMMMILPLLLLGDDDADVDDVHSLSDSGRGPAGEGAAEAELRQRGGGQQPAIRGDDDRMMMMMMMMMMMILLMMMMILPMPQAVGLLAKERLRPNFGNAGAVNNLLSAATI